MTTAEEMLRATDEILSDGVRRQMMQQQAQELSADGRMLTIDGAELVNFGSCSYLGLERHPALVAGVTDAVHRYGTQFSSSRAYVSAPDYALAEAELGALFGRPALITSSTSLGHIAALPSLAGSSDALILDHQVHQSVQAAARHARAQGCYVTLVPHNDLRTLERRVAELSRTHRRVWYCTDGLFSMFADFAPIAEINELMARHPRLWLYADDAHGVSWTGRHGCGHVLPRLSAEAATRAVVVGSLNKSFAAGGGVLTFPDAESRRLVFTIGGPMVFSGPLQPPMLGAVLASARLHRTAEVAQRQARLHELIRHFNDAVLTEGLPLVSPSEAPIRCVGNGVPSIAYEVTARLRRAGYFVDTAVFPGVPAKLCGTRIALTANHTEADIDGLVDALAEALPRALASADSSAAQVSRSFARYLAGRPVRLRAAAAESPVKPDLKLPELNLPELSRPELGRPELRLPELRMQRAATIGALDENEWDRLFRGRGAMAASGLRALERTFAAGPEPEHSWRFHYCIVRDRSGAPIAATFFTTALWKEDMISNRHVSAQVERERAANPYHLTSTMVATGTLLTEGNHLYLDRSGPWRPALRMILREMRAEEDRVDAAAIMLRDLPDGDDELHRFLLAEGMLRVPIYPSWIRELDFADDGQFLAGLRKKQRYHQRTAVHAWEDRFQVAVIRGGETPAPPAVDLDEMYELYRNVHARNLDLNVYALPRRLLDEVVAQPGWEIITLRLPEIGPGLVGFMVQHCAAEHVQPVLVGLDYAYSASHHTYQQLLWQAIRSGRRHGVPRVLLGMSADLQKARFGATPRKGWVYLQPTSTYHGALLAHLAEGIGEVA